MAKISDETVERWRELAVTYCKQFDRTPADVGVGRQAWSIAHATGMCIEAYKDESIHDAHIQTALAKIFPNALFRDKKVY